MTVKSIRNIIRWTARIIGSLLLLLFIFFLFGEGPPNPFNLTFSEHFLGIAMLIMAAGLIIAWKWEGGGGILILGGFVLFAVLNRGIQLNLVFGPMLLCGILYLIYWILIIQKK